jgi:hypothetical protein
MKEPDEKVAILAEIRRQRDWHASHGMLDEALMLDGRIRDLEEGRTSVTVECVMRRFESAVARYDADRIRIN